MHRLSTFVVTLACLFGCTGPETSDDGSSGGSSSTDGSSSSTGVCQPPYGDCLAAFCPGGAVAETVRGECGPPQCVCPPACMSNADCTASELCRFHEYGCGGEGVVGYCEERPLPATCPQGPEVCGCDGDVYPSRCAAAVAGVPILDAPTTDCEAAATE